MEDDKNKDSGRTPPSSVPKASKCSERGGGGDDGDSEKGGEVGKDEELTFHTMLVGEVLKHVR